MEDLKRAKLHKMEDLRLSYLHKMKNFVLCVMRSVAVQHFSWGLDDRLQLIAFIGGELLFGDSSFPSVVHTEAANVGYDSVCCACFGIKRIDRRGVLAARGSMALVRSQSLLSSHYLTDVIVSVTICPLISYVVRCVWSALESVNGGKPLFLTKRKYAWRMDEGDCGIVA